MPIGEVRGSPPQRHGSKPGTFNLKFVISREACRLLLQDSHGVLGPVLREAIVKSREAIKSSTTFLLRCGQRGIHHDQAELNVKQAKINVYAGGW